MAGRKCPISPMVTRYSSSCVNAGTIAAVNSLPIDCSVMMPNTISAAEGGTAWPSVPPAAMMPAAKPPE